MKHFPSPLKTIFRAFIYCFWIASAANAQVQLGEDLVGTDIGDRFGANLEISDDGNRVIIGAFGYAQVFEWVDSSNWNQVGSTFFPPIEDNYFGEVVDIANGGTTVMVVNKREDQNGFEQCGSVRVFDWSSSDWQQRGSTMHGSDDNEFFGADAVLSTDGLTVVAAANWFGWSDGLNMIGQVRRYDWIDGEWVSENGSIDGGNGVQRFGTQLDLSADGLRLVAGGVGAGNGGIVRTYEWTEGGWTTSSEDISIPDQIYSDASGMCLSLSADGQTLVVSTTARTNRYEWIDGVGWQLINTWWERAWGLSLSADGALLSHGNAAGANQWGTLRLMEWGNEAWSELSLETGSALNHNFGYSAGISASGNVHGSGAIGESGFGNETIEGYVRLFGEAPGVLIPGCTDEAACNFNEEANEDDDTCIYPLFGEDCEMGGAACGDGTVWDASIQACVCFNDCPSDLNGNGIVEVTDLLMVLADFGTECPLEVAEFTCGDPVSYHGYDYATVQIGEQCWFAENLRNENYENGDAIPSNSSNSEWSSTTSGATAVNGESASNLETYGRLYNWYAVDDARGLCPSGWHVPLDVEWMTMEMALGMSEAEANDTGWRGSDQGTQMKTDYGWGDSGNGTNSSGFSGLPGGLRYISGSFGNPGVLGGWWSSSPVGSDAWLRHLTSLNVNVNRYNDYRRVGWSVRCVQD